MRHFLVVAAVTAASTLTIAEEPRPCTPCPQCPRPSLSEVVDMRNYPSIPDNVIVTDPPGGGYLLPPRGVRPLINFGVAYVDGLQANFFAGARIPTRRGNAWDVMGGPMWADHNGTPVDFTYREWCRHTPRYTTVQIDPRNPSHMGVGVSATYSWGRN